MIESHETLLTDYRFKTKPLTHQLEAFTRSRDLEAYGLFMEQGTGKSKVAIDTAAWLKCQDLIDAVLVVCPYSVILTWTEIEFPAHLPDHIAQFSRFVPWRKSLIERYSRNLDGLFPNTELGLRVLVINPQSLIKKDALAFCERFVRTNRTLVIIDESQSIKTPGTQTTKAAYKLGLHASYRRIMTGTPIANNTLDLFTQFNFLDPEILGYGSFYAFRNHFAVMRRVQYGAGGRPHDEVVGFQNEDELKQLIEPYSYRVLKSECLDLPDKVYQVRFVELTPAQRRVYDQMKKEALANVDGETLDQVREETEQALPEEKDATYTQTASAVHAAIKLLRLHQIASGWVKNDAGQVVGVAEPNPKLEALLAIIREELASDQKVIIWANYRHDIETIAAALQAKYGPKSAAKFYGGMGRDEKQAVINGIQDAGSQLRFFVGHPKAGGSGITLTGANVVIYYSNSYNLIDRLQSEDRCHRIGQSQQVTYIDIVAHKTVDAKILQALQSKVDLARAVMKMDYRELEELFA